MRAFTIPESVFKTEPLFVGNCTESQMLQYLSKRFGLELKNYGPLDDSTIGTVLTLDRLPWRVVWVRKFSMRTEELANAMHEIFHLVVRICRDKGVPIVANIASGECGDEAAAYIFDFFAMEYIRRIR